MPVCPQSGTISAAESDENVLGESRLTRVEYVDSLVILTLDCGHDERLTADANGKVLGHTPQIGERWGCQDCIDILEARLRKARGE
jgi:hypothetical protein